MVQNDYRVDSVIYWWTGSMWVEWQRIPTNGAVKWSFFKSQYEDPMLVVANSKAQPVTFLLSLPKVASDALLEPLILIHVLPLPVHHNFEWFIPCLASPGDIHVRLPVRGVRTHPSTRTVACTRSSCWRRHKVRDAIQNQRWSTLSGCR